MAQAQYCFSALDVPGATGTVPQGINDSGNIVGCYDDAKGRHGFLYARGNFTTIDYPGAPNTRALWNQQFWEHRGHRQWRVSLLRREFYFDSCASRIVYVYCGDWWNQQLRRNLGNLPIFLGGRSRVSLCGEVGEFLHFHRLSRRR